MSNRKKKFKKLKVNDELILISDHAEKRMKERKITDNDIIKTYTKPDATYPQKNKKGRTNYLKQFEGYRIRIGVDVRGKKPNILATAIKIISKIGP